LESSGFQVFVGDVISGVSLGFFGPQYLALDANC